MSALLPLSPAAAFAVECVAKATLVLMAAGAAAWVVTLRRGPAAARHLAWTLGVCGALALPLLSAALPGWRTPLLAVPTSESPAPATFVASPVLARPPISPMQAVAPRVDAAAERVPATEDAGGGFGMPTLLVLYLAGVLAVVGRLVIGRWSVARLARKAEPVQGAAWAALLADLCWQMDVRRPVRLLRSARATMPMTWGIARPTVLLPAEADGWPEERRRVVLLHELAHVARHDCLTQTVAAGACALYWFHPAAWHAARRLRVERELACDDRVLQAGTRAGVYAAHLLEVARAFRPAPLAGAVAVSMARPSQLEGRLLAVLDGVRNRAMLTRPAASAAAVVALALVLPLAAIRPAYAQQPVPAGVTFGGAGPSGETAKTKPARGPDAYPDLDAALRQGVVDVTLAARPGERLTLRLPDGVSARVEAWDRPSVHVRVEDRGLRVRAERGEGGPHVTVTGRPRTDETEPQVRIQAPRNFNVHTQADGGGLEIGALNGTFTGSVTGGGLAFVGTRGTVRMTAHGGGAFVSRTHLHGRLEMNGGGVLLDRNTGDLDVSDAATTVHGRAGGPLRVTAPARAGTRGGDAEVACAGDACTITSTRATTVGGGTSARVATSTRGGVGETVTVAAPSVHATVTGSAIRTTVASPAVRTAVTGSAVRTTVATPSVHTTVTTRGPATTVVSGAATAGPVTTVSVGGGRARASGRSQPGAAVSSSATTVSVGDATGGEGTTTVVVGTGPATTISGYGAATRDRDGYAYTTGDVAGRIAAVRAMGRNAPPAAAAQGLGRLAFSERDPAVQRAVVEELARLRTRGAREQLRRIASDHPRAAIRAQAAAAVR